MAAHPHLHQWKGSFWWLFSKWRKIFVLDKSNKSVLKFVPSSLEDWIFFLLNAFLRYWHFPIGRYATNSEKGQFLTVFLDFLKLRHQKKIDPKKKNSKFFFEWSDQLPKSLWPQFPVDSPTERCKNGLRRFLKDFVNLPSIFSVLKLQMSWEKCLHVHYSCGGANERLWWWSFGKS